MTPVRLFCLTIFAVFCYVVSCFSELPPALPGEEITDQYLRWKMPVDTIKQKAKEKKTVEWYDKVAKTWEAPPISEQMAKDRTTVPMGKGGIFIPRLTELHKEPDIEIVDSLKRTVVSGEPGVTYSVEPGKYSVMIGSGTHRQRIIRNVEVEEFNTVPVLPDWSGLIVETIDTNSTVIRGEYEVVRIDEFEPFGRGYGADVTLGEAVKAWILKPGIYKILGRGESYNTLKNFVTVRLLPGELTRLVLIEREDDMAIMGGGTIEIDAGRKITSNWKYGGNVGGNIQFVGDIDRSQENRQDDLSSMLSLNTAIWLRYLNNPIDWETTISLKEGFNIDRQVSSFSFQGAADDFKVRSLFIWRFYKWLGPYGNSEFKTNLLPKNLLRDKKERFYFIKDDNSLDTANYSIESSLRLNPSFCPLTVDIGGGANIDALNLNMLDIAVRLGAGGSYNNYPDRYSEVPNSKAVYDRESLELDQKVKNSILLRREKRKDIFELGPLGSISGNLRIGRFGSASAEIKLFAPVFPENRFENPDFDLSTILSWRVARGVTLDYEFSYQLKQPEDAKVNLASNTILLRFSFSSR